MPSVNLARERSLYTAFTDQAVQSRQRELARLRERMTTGLAVNRASDDSAAFSQAKQLEALLNRHAQYQRTIDASRGWVVSTESALNDLGELFTQAQEEVVRIANGNFNDDDREVVAERLESIYGTVVDTLNTKYNGEYLLAGSRTTVEPFTLAAGTVTYNGNAGGRERHIGRNVTVDVNVSGQDLLDTGSGFTITEAFENMIAAVRTNDSAQIDTALGDLTTARDHILDQGSAAGDIAKRLELAGTQLTDASLTLEERRSHLEDADLATTLTDLQRAQSGLQAALQVAASVVQTTILDFLR